MGLNEYQKKRNFAKTPEPADDAGEEEIGFTRFVIQKHAASRLHYDLRLEIEGVYKSWALPKGPTLNPNEQHLAVQTEDHPLAYGRFEGVIPPKNYGAGTVMIWDAGKICERASSNEEENAKRLIHGLETGRLTLLFYGRKMRGEFALIQLKDGPKNWLFLKKRDEFASYKLDLQAFDRSAATDRTLEEIASEAQESERFWLPKKGASHDAVLQAEKLLYENVKPLWLPSPKSDLRLPPLSKPKETTGEENEKPHFVKPMLASSFKQLLEDPEWFYEPNWGGLRCIAIKDKHKVSLYSKQKLKFSYPKVEAELKSVEGDFVLDGELVRPVKDGFSKPKGKKEETQLLISDLLHHNGLNMRNQTLAVRKEKLGSIIKDSEFIKLNPYRKAGTEFLPHAPVFLIKDPSSNYTSGTSKSWLKVISEEKEQKVRITSRSKLYFPDEEITKGEIIDYYEAVSPYILPYLKDRPMSLNRHPNGINSPGFYQKDMQGYHPVWFETCKIESGSAGKSIQYALCQNKNSLLYLANLGCIELHPWLSKTTALDQPDLIAIDIDAKERPFGDVIRAALTTYEILTEIGCQALCKTSGATGMHIIIPTSNLSDYVSGRNFAEKICREVTKRIPDITTTTRNPAKRGGKIYMDFLQNRRGQTLASVYCVRPRPGAPVSMPVAWDELEADLKPEMFHVKNSLDRIEKLGDRWSETLSIDNDIASKLTHFTVEPP